jgi:hypothetical protein
MGRKIIIILGMGLLSCTLSSCTVKPDMSHYYDESSYLSAAPTKAQAGIGQQIRYSPRPVRGSHYNYMPSYR